MLFEIIILYGSCVSLADYWNNCAKRGKSNKYITLVPYNLLENMKPIWKDKAKPKNYYVGDARSFSKMTANKLYIMVINRAKIS